MVTVEGKRYTTISIPASLAERIKRRIEGTGFRSLSEYVIYILREVISSEKEEVEEPFTKEDEEKVKEKLRALGYLD